MLADNIYIHMELGGMSTCRYFMITNAVAYIGDWESDLRLELIAKADRGANLMARVSAGDDS